MLDFDDKEPIRGSAKSFASMNIRRGMMYELGSSGHDEIGDQRPASAFQAA
ncbi:hypothetical protein ACP_3229 [Acidobacterium capsulatum ATCC 51196]|uniref:Uncharacterized protein n=1 Tax=Acidobacterium capsulatum (strain ATCC 51196 / DSM 11244 / BCRC 80197 / JCM 7670 / NBRC 15755 / NCIMB 13165 / 161) TaxID=240015 RepID=C1F5P9_ACIC5|nr:hypothetical protein ACP_3229 [Acidobacterium capsulatum ATCC 51196]